MAFAFPCVEEIRLQRAPLAEVICQVRFPTILAIGGRPPVALQEKVRERLPIYEPVHEVTVEAREGDPSPRSSATPVFRFSDSQRRYVLTVAPDFYALSTSTYTHWEDFRELLAFAGDAVCDVYNPAFASRIGLRYINFLDQGTTGCTNLSDIAALVRPELAAMLHLDAVPNPDMAIHYLRASNGDDVLALRSGIVTDPGEPGPKFVL
ncbi:MAG: TIGR04255 family protein, partial [Anaerolineae bacterium]